jgi:hypothetical protein
MSHFSGFHVKRDRWPCGTFIVAVDDDEVAPRLLRRRRAAIAVMTWAAEAYGRTAVSYRRRRDGVLVVIAKQEPTVHAAEARRGRARRNTQNIAELMGIPEQQVAGPPGPQATVTELRPVPNGDDDAPPA